jgi:hypothetical protein
MPKPVRIVEKTPEREKVKNDLVDAFKERGFEIFKRESFFKWMDQEVHLVQNDAISAVFFLRVQPKDEDSWDISKELFESFTDLIASDEETVLYVVLLKTTATGLEGYMLTDKDFDEFRDDFDTDEDREEVLYKIPKAKAEELFKGKEFGTMDEFFDIFTKGAPKPKPDKDK